MVQCIRELASRSYWIEWATIRCPTLIVRGAQGNFDAQHVEHLARQLSDGRSITIPGAGHDVHLDAPTALAAELGHFLG